MAVTYTGEAIFGKRLNLADAKTLLALLDQSDVLEFCALLNAVNQISAHQVGGYKTVKGADLLNRLLADLLHPVYHVRAWNIFRQSDPFHFSPLAGAAINGLIGLACRWCPKEGGHKLVSVRYRQNVTRVLFALQDAMINKEKMLKIGDPAGLRAAFPYLTRSVLANQTVSMTHDLGRLHAFVARPEVGAVLGRELKSAHPIDKWFIDSFGLPVSTYQRVMTAFAGYAAQFKAATPRSSHLWLTLNAFLDACAELRAGVQALLECAQTTPDRVASNVPEPLEMADAVYSVDHLLVYPLLRVGDYHLVTSFEAVFNKFIRGLPYLSDLMARQKRGEADAFVVKAARSGFGYIFEGYSRWLARQWFAGISVEVIEDYRIRLPGHKKRDDLAQRDLLFIHNDVGYAIETKAKVPPLQARRTGDLEQVVQMVLPREEGDTIDRTGLIVQARTAAEALVAGAAFLSDKETQIRPLKRVFPIGLVFEHLPLRYPFTRPFEADVEQFYGKRVFQDSGRVAPIQFFDITDFEEWDEVFDMPSEGDALLTTLQKRATTEELRYNRLTVARGGRRANFSEKTGVVRSLANESEHFVHKPCENHK